MEVRFIGKRTPVERRKDELFMDCREGKIYVVISIENDWYRIVDESGEDYLYPPTEFEIVGGSAADIDPHAPIFNLSPDGESEDKEVPGVNLFNAACDLIDETGQGKDADYLEAMRLLREAAQIGNIDAMNNLGILYYRGYGVEKNYDEALKWIRRGAAYGDETAYENLALMYSKGYGVPKNCKIAADMYLALAENGNTDAMTSLAFLYYHEGVDGKPNYWEAFHWYSEAADLDDPVGLDETGCFYRDGIVVEQDSEKARDYFVRAAERGDVSAMNDMADMFCKGYGVEKDYWLALFWSKEAVKHGSGIAASNIGSLYEAGSGVPKNLGIAFAWYKKAVSLGFDKAIEDVERLRKNMSTQTIQSTSQQNLDDTIWSIYDRIHEALKSNGELPSSFTVNVNPDPDEVFWADGAWDGVCCYHNRLPEPDLTQMVNAVQLASDNAFGHAETALIQVFSDENNSMLAYIDAIQKWIVEHSEQLNANYLYRFARHLLMDSYNKEVVKFGLSVMEIISSGDDEVANQAIRELGASDEFTLFALFAIQGKGNGNDEIFQMAKRVHGWGRIHAVERLEPTSEEIKQWLLREGVNNDVMSEYSALTVAEKVDLLKIVQNVDSNSEDFIAAGEILQALINCEGGPTEGIEEYEKAEALIRTYIDKARRSLPDERIYDVLRTIKIHYDDEEETESIFSAFAKEASAIISSDACMSYLRNQVRRGECLWFASQLGVDCSKEIKAAFQRDWRKNDGLLQFLDNPSDIIEMTAFFLDNVKDKDILTPKNNIIGGIGNSTFDILLPRLTGYSVQEEHLLELGLRTPVKRSRSMSLARLREWKENGKLTNNLRCAIDKWKASESDKKLLSEYHDL